MPELTAVPPRSIAGISSFRDQERLHAALRDEFGVSILSRACFVQAGRITLACLAPMRFLAIAPAATNLPTRLAQSLHGLAAVTDQSDMWATWHVCGPHVRDCLARVVPIDLAPDIFQIGDLALTSAGHLDVRVSRIEPDGYEVAVSRSMAADLLHALEAAKKGRPVVRQEGFHSCA